MINPILRSGLLVLTLFAISGCNLKVHIIGSGTIKDLNSNFSCSEGTCTQKNNGSPKRFELVAEPDPGHTNIGILVGNNLYDATDGHYYYTSIGFKAPDIMGGSESRGQGYQAPSAEDANLAESQETSVVDPAITYTPVLYYKYEDEVSGIFLPSNEIIEIKTTYLSKCALLTEDRIKCWGSRFQGVPDSFKNITKFDASSYTACAMDNSGLKCWGSAINTDVFDPNSIENPKDFVLVSGRGCALHEASEGNKVTCWGYGEQYYPTPSFSNPTAIRKIEDHSTLVCATHDDGETCWGEGYWNQEAVPDELGVVSDFSAAANHTCAISNGKVHCWGGGSVLEVPAGIVNPQKIYSTATGACVVGDSGLTCWGSKIPSFPEGYTNIQNLVFNNSTSCIDIGNSLVCKHYSEETVYPYTEISSLTAGTYAICYLDNGVAKCLNSRFFQEQLGELTGITQLALEHYAACHISQTGLGCYEVGGYSNVVPELTIAANNLLTSPNYSCAIENDTLDSNTLFQCWGNATASSSWSNSNRGQLPPSVLPGIYDKIEAGMYHTCALKDGELNCWGVKNPPK